MLDKSGIEPAMPELASPAVFAIKKSRKLRSWFGYRKLNGVTVRDKYPLPRMDKCIDSVVSETIFSTNQPQQRIPVD